MVSLYEVTNSGEYALGSNITPDGYYSFVVRQNRKYKILLEVTGYENASYPIDTRDFSGQSSILKDLAMKGKFDEEIRPEVPGDPNPIVVTTEDPVKPDLNPPGSNPEITPPGRTKKEDIKKHIDDEREETRPERVPPITGVIEKAEEEQPDNPPPYPTFEEEETPPVEEEDIVTNVIEVEQEEQNRSRFNTDGSPKILDTKYLGDLTRGQIQEIIVVNDEQYLPVEDGFWKILEPDTDTDFPGIGGGLGQHFRIQLAAVSTYKPYKFTAALDALDGSEIVRETAVSRDGKEVERIMLASFRNFEEAKRALRKLREEGYDRAFIISYENDRRKGSMIRDID